MLCVHGGTMEILLEKGWLNFGVSILIALSVYFIVLVVLYKVFKPKGFWWVFILLSSICIFLVTSTLDSGKSLTFLFLNSAGWAFIGISVISIQKIREE